MESLCTVKGTVGSNPTLSANFKMKKKELTLQEIFNLAITNQQKNNFAIAKDLYEKVLKIKPNHVLTLYNLGNVLKELDEHEKAVNYYLKAIQSQPNFTPAYHDLGLTFQGLKKHNKAIEYYEKAIQIQNDLAPAHYNLGNTLKEIGEYEKAINSYQKAAKYAPENLTTFYNLCDLKKDVLDENLKKKIEKILKKKNYTKMDAAYGNFLLSRYEYKDKNHEKELKYLLKAHNYYFESINNEFNEQVKYFLNKLPNIKELFNFDKLNKNINKKNNELKPIFIIGTPRSGSTLIEKVIASGSMHIPIGEETEIINSSVRQIIKRAQFANLNIENLKNEIIEKYKKKKLVYKNSDYTFTDKSLENFFYIGLIKKIFPQAKVINCKRDSLSTIVSILKNNLTGISWAHNIKHIFKYFDIYYKVIENFKKKFPDFIYELEIEKFTKNPEIESKKLFNFCNLPWEKKCLEFYKRKDLVSLTASNIQVRSAIYYEESTQKYLPYKRFLNKFGKKYHWFNI